MKLIDRIKEKLQNLDDKNRRYVFGGLLLLIVVVYILLFLIPQFHIMNKTSGEIALLKKDMDEAKANQEHLPQYNKSVAELQVKMVELNKSVKSRNEVPIIMETITRLADQSHIKIDQVMPISDQIKLLVENNQKKYFALPISVEAQGGYHDFARFINQLENADIMLEINQFTITSRENVKNHKIRLIIKTVVYEETGKSS